VCVDGLGRVLLCRMSSTTRTPGTWTLPGGGVQHGEEPARAVLRELTEETGLVGRVGRLLGIHENVYEVRGASIHGFHLLYSVETAGGPLTAEAAGGSTDGVAWMSTAEVAAARLSDHAAYTLGLVGVAAPSPASRS
jgi:8-oxo-dGTP diphosphatase